MDKLLRILYVDDDETNLKVVQHILEAFNASVVCCGSPEEGLGCLSVERFHAVLLDIHMPRMSGVELLQEFRRRGGPNASTPVLALTADTTRAERDYVALGFDGLVSKPVSIKPLLQKLLDVVAARNGAPATVPLARSA